MTAGVYDIVCEQGATFRRTFTWADENDQPINLTGCTVRMQVRPTFTSATTWLNLTSPTDITLTPLAGQITVAIAASTTATLPVKRGVYDLEVVMTNGDVHRLLRGSFDVSPEVTR